MPENSTKAFFLNLIHKLLIKSVQLKYFNLTPTVKNVAEIISGGLW